MIHEPLHVKVTYEEGTFIPDSEIRKWRQISNLPKLKDVSVCDSRYAQV